MTPRQVDDQRLLVWGADDIEYNTILQAGKCSRLPFIEGHVALMPDAHVGMGATVGSVIPTRGAIIPAAVGVDIGCGMIATETSLTASDLPDSLAALMPLISERIPAGVGQGHKRRRALEAFAIRDPATELTDRQQATVGKQFGTLGSGNHFVEVCLDERDIVWIVLHSGSRGIGNQLAQTHINGAKGLMRERFIKLEDPDLAYLVEGEPSFQAYIADMLFSQDYAMASREVMMVEALGSLQDVVGLKFTATRTINCHHNFTEREHHMGKDLWITRKGAIRAREGDFGVIPGSMGTGTYIVSGKGMASSFNSCSHGAGRRMSRGQAKRELTQESLEAAMAGKTWNDSRAGSLVDEHPQAYKDIESVMDAQSDLVNVEHVLHQIFNYKGV